MNYINRRFDRPMPMPVGNINKFVWGTPTIPDIYWNQYSYEQKIKWLYQQYARLIEYLKYLVDQINKVLKEFDDRITSLEERMTALEARMTALEARMTQLENRMSSLEGRMTVVEQEIEAIKERLDSAESRLDSLEERMTAVEQDIDELNDKFTELNNKFDDLNTKYGNLEEMYGDLDIQFRKLKQDYEAAYKILNEQAVVHVEVLDRNGSIYLVETNNLGNVSDKFTGVNLYQGKSYEAKTLAIFDKELQKIITAEYPIPMVDDGAEEPTV